MAKNYFKSYIWLLETLQSRGPLTLKEIKKLWIDSSVNEDGKELATRTFANHIASIADVFGIDIVCDRRDNTYYIENIEDLNGRGIRNWMLNALCLNSMLSEGASMHVFLDACYFKSGVHYAPGDSDWKDTLYPFTAELESKLAASDVPTYIFMHQNIDPGIREDHRLSNAEELLRIIEKSGVVRAVFQGHYHPGQSSRQGGVDYIALPAMCENESAYWVYEL